MPTKTPDPAPAELTLAERRAQKVARREERRATRTRWDLSNHPPCGPPGGYVVVNAPAHNDAELTTDA